MSRVLVLSTVVLLIPCLAQGQSWTEKMFEETSHDFGTVGRGAEAEFAFKFTNLYEEQVHVAAVKTSCGCTTPVITDELVETHETSSIVARFNTLTFTGQKNAVITVVFDQPYYAEQQLLIQGHIRTDVTFDPPQVQFGQLRDPSRADRTITVQHVGRSDWTIRDVRSESGYYQVKLGKPIRKGTTVTYQLNVQLDEDTPPCELNQPLVLVTDDQSLQQLTLGVTGRVLPALTVSPASLSFGVVAGGEAESRRVVLRADEPFTLQKAESDDPRVKCEFDAEAKKLHFVNVTFAPPADADAEKVLESIKLETDLQGGRTATIMVTGQVQDAP